MAEHSLWVEKYRPTRLENYVGNEHLKAKKLFKIINRKRKLSFVNRILYEKLNDKQMFFLAEKFSNSSEPLSILSESDKWRLKTVFRWLNYK